MSIIRMYFTPDGASRPSHYREAWWEPDEFVVHHGKVGQPGKTTVEAVSDADQAQALLESFAAQNTADGYQDVEDITHESFTVVIRYKTATPSEVENTNAEKFFSALTGLLAWRGLGIVEQWKAAPDRAAFLFPVQAIHRAKASQLAREALKETEFRPDRMRIERT